VSVATPGRARRERTATESLLSIVLVLEAFVVFFVALTVFGLGQVPGPVALGGGAALILILVLDARLVRSPVGVWIGWALQVVLILLGLVNPVMWFVGAGFAALWTYCCIRGRQLDRAKAEYLAAHPPAAEAEAASGTSPSETSTSDTSKETE
jgi:hypothetical protein